MKKDIHPKRHEIIIQMTNGKTFTTLSTYGKPGDTIVLDSDPHNHRAWTGIERGAMENVSNVAKYRKRFGSLNLFGDADDNQDGNADNNQDSNN